MYIVISHKGTELEKQTIHDIDNVPEIKEFDVKIYKEEMYPWIDDIEDATIKNSYFRKVVSTGPNLQVVYMSIEKEIGEEIHDDTDQFIRVESGRGKVILDDKSYLIKDGMAFHVHQGVKHNVINLGKDPLKLYTIYSPPHHLKGIIEP